MKEDKGSRHYLADCKDFFKLVNWFSYSVLITVKTMVSAPGGNTGNGDRKVQASWIHARSVLRHSRLFHEETRVSSVLQTPESDTVLARL